MNYPLAKDYIDSIKYAEDNFATLVNLLPIVDENNNPSYKIEGKCIVFKMKDSVSNKLYCVKCFLTEQFDRAERYHEIIQSNLFFPKESQYLENELFVDSDVSNIEEFPIVLYPCVNKTCLVDYIQHNLNNKHILIQLACQFSQIIKWSKDNNYYWNKLDITKIFVNEYGLLVFYDIEELLQKKSSETEYVQADEVSILMILLSLKVIAINPSFFTYEEVKSHLLFTIQDGEHISKNEVFQKMIQLDDKETNSLIGYLLICLNFTNNCGINSKIFRLKPAFESVQDELLYYAEKGDDNKQVELARLYYKQKSYEEAFKWFEIAARQGNPDGINGVGCCYKLGIPVEKDERRAVELFSIAADKGSERAQYNLAMAYYSGNGIELDEEKAITLFKKLAEKGESQSQYMLGKYLMINHMGTISWHIVSKRNTKEAFKWFEKSALQGHSGSQQQLGKFYESGTDPCLRNIEKALEWYQKSANQGNKEALFALGRIYANGIDDEHPDVAKAYHFFLKAAESGHPEAQYRVGVALYYGKGIVIDKESALTWLKKSASQRNEDAQKLLYQLESEKEDVTFGNTEATQGEMANAKMDSYGVLYSADGRKLLHYGIDDVTEDMFFGLIKQQSLRVYEVPEGVEIICNEAFSECQSLIKIILPSTLKFIGNMAFYKCTNLESIVIPEGVKSIDYLTFSGCDSLHNLVLPHSLESIDSDALTGVSGILSYSPHFVVKEGCLFSSDLKALIYFFHDGRTQFDIPQGTECIEDCSFAESSIHRLHIPSTVSTIGRSAFANCHNLQDVDLPSSITIIGGAAFLNCESLYKIRLPQNLKCIDVQTFDGCRNLSYLHIPDTVEEIGSQAFARTKIDDVVLPMNLKKIGVMAFVLAPLSRLKSNSNSFIVDNMTIYSKDGKELIQYYGKEKKVTVPNTVVKIASMAFACAYSIRELVIPNSVEEIGRAFLYEILPEKIIVPAKLKNIVISLTESYYHSHIIVNE